MEEIVHNGSTSLLEIRVGFYESYKMEIVFNGGSIHLLKIRA
jgi:hypothetical protein